jgi:DNA-binding LytR/AlgR family response regulator
MINAIAIDDEPLALKVIENFCAKIDFVFLEKTFHKPKEGIIFLEKQPVDLVFLDINMPAISGLDLAKTSLRETMVIFTTAYSEYAVEGFNLNAIDYLLKPFTFDRFEQALQKAKAHYEYTQSHHLEKRFLLIRADYKLHKINIDEILFIEGLDDYLKIYLAHQKPLVARMTLKKLLEKLPISEFVRVHRSFIVPIQKVQKFNNKVIVIEKHEIPIGVSYEEEVQKWLTSN